MSMAEAQFGPYVLSTLLVSRNDVELYSASLFDGSTSTPVALRRTRVYDDGACEPFLAGARNYAVLRHEAIVPVIDLGSYKGRSYAATRLIRGKNLLRVIAQCGVKRMGFPTDVALYVMTRILDALAAAHEKKDRDGGNIGLAHGDLSHTNVLIDHDGAVYVSDFGMRLASTRRRTLSGLDARGNRGFAAYLAPEQVDARTETVAADIFVAGILLYELVSGHRLFNASHEQEVQRMVGGRKFDIPLERHRPDLHPGIKAAIHTALAADPADRFQSAAEFRTAVDHVVRDVGVQLTAETLANLMHSLFDKGNDQPKKD